MAAGTAPALVVPGQAVSLRVVAANARGLGEASDRITLVPAALPSPPAAIRAQYPLDGSLALDWSVPADTGGGDATSVPAASIYYMLEVDEGFFEASAGQSNFSPLTSFDPAGVGLYKSTTFTHENLIVGHEYVYRVKASNLMGYGAYSAEFVFVPRTVPAKPKLAPRNRPTLTTRSRIYIEYDAVLEDGGAAISSYNVYIDDGHDSDIFISYSAGPSLMFDTL